MTYAKQKKDAEDTIKCIDIFRKKLNEKLKAQVQNPALQAIEKYASNDDIRSLIDLGMAAGGMKLSSVKSPLIVSTCTIDGKPRATTRMIRSNLIVQLCITKIPNIYKTILLEFLKEGYKDQMHDLYVRKLMLFYIQTDIKNNDTQLVNQYNIDSYLNHADFKFDTENSLCSKDKEYIHSLYKHGSRVVKKLKKISDAIVSGAKTHGFVLTLMKDDRYIPTLEYYENGRVAGDVLIIQHIMQILGISDKFTLVEREQTLAPISTNSGKPNSIRTLLPQFFKKILKTKFTPFL
jgi:hypothetical protein